MVKGGKVMFDFWDDIGVAILGTVLVIGWLAFFGSLLMMPTDLPNECILYEEKIWCEVNE